MKATKSIAFMFPGTGAERVGMGKDLFNEFAPARRLFREANEIVGFDLARVIFEGPLDSPLPITCSQPASLTLSVVLATLLAEADVYPAVVTGHSHGEVAALVIAGVLSFQEAIRLVLRRAQLIEALGPRHGAMMAVIGASREQVGVWCNLASTVADVEIANYNAPRQIVVSGESAGLEVVEQLALKSGACQCIRLRIRHPFHTRLLKRVENALEDELREVNFRDAEIPVISNADGTSVRSGAAWRSLFLRQLCGTVDWVRTVECVNKYRPSFLIELGAGRVLQGLVRRMTPGVEVLGAQCCKTVRHLISRLSLLREIPRYREGSRELCAT